MLEVNSLLDTLWHTTTYTPKGYSGVDKYNQPVPGMGTAVPNTPCRLREAGSTDILAAQAAGIQRVDYVVTVKATLDVTTDGQFSAFADVNAVSLLTGSLVVMHVTTRKLLDQPIFKLCYCNRIEK